MMTKILFTIITLFSLKSFGQYCPQEGCDSIGSGDSVDYGDISERSSPQLGAQVIIERSSGPIHTSSCESLPVEVIEKHSDRAISLALSAAMRTCNTRAVQDFETTFQKEICERFYCGWGCGVTYAGAEIRATFSCK